MPILTTIIVFILSLLSKPTSGYPRRSHRKNIKSLTAELSPPSIVGGTEATIDDYPFIAFLGITEFPFDLFSCGASILRKEYPAIILTAAHCVGGNITESEVLSSYWVRVGANSISDSAAIKSGISRMEIHPQYNFFTDDNDIALLWLDTDISSYTQLASVDLLGLDCCTDGEALKVIGYGAECDECDVTPTLEVADVLYVDRAICDAAYAIDYGVGSVTENMICDTFEGDRKGSCSGDSGGPLIITGTTQQVGIVSTATGCANASFPGINTNIAAVYEWIESLLYNTTATEATQQTTEGSIDIEGDDVSGESDDDLSDEESDDESGDSVLQLFRHNDGEDDGDYDGYGVRIKISDWTLMNMWLMGAFILLMMIVCLCYMIYVYIK